MSKELEARLDAIESRFAIDALIANYAEAFDTMNIELLATLWHPESRLLLGANGTPTAWRPSWRKHAST